MRSSYCRGLAGLVEVLEPRTLLAAVNLASVDGFARGTAVTASYAYFGVDPAIDGKRQFSALERTNLRTAQSQSISPAKGSKWNLDQAITFYGGRDGAWIDFKKTGELWFIADDQRRATRIVSADGATYRDSYDDNGTAVVSPDHKHFYLARIDDNSGQARVLVSDGTASGTKTLFSVGDITRPGFVLTSNGVLVVSQESSDGSVPQVYYFDDSAPDKPVDITSRFDGLGDFYQMSAVPRADGSTYINTEDGAYLANASMKEISAVTIKAVTKAGHQIESIAPIDGGIGYLTTGLGNNHQIWVSDAKGADARRVGSYQFDDIGAIYSTKLLAAGSLFTIYDTGASAIESGSNLGDPVQANDVLKDPALYKLSFAKGLTRIAIGSFDTSLTLADGHSYAAGFGSYGGLIDVTDASKPTSVAVETFETVTNGKQLVFSSHHSLMTYNAAVKAGMVTGNVDIIGTDNNQIYPDSSHVARPSVYADLNRNAKRDTNEPSSITENDGQFYLAGVPAGRVVTLRVDGDAIALSGIDTAVATVKVKADGESTRGFELKINTSNIQVNAFEDLDGDGVRDANEPGIEGLKIVSAKKSGAIDYRAFVPTRATQSNGRVMYKNLHYADAFRIGIRETDQFFAGTSSTVVIQLLPGRTQRVDFPMRRDPRTGSLTFRPFEDLDGDGVRSSDEPLLGTKLKVALYRNGVRYGSARTNSAGAVSFKHLYRGTYHVDLEGVPTDANEMPVIEMDSPDLTLHPGQRIARNLAGSRKPMITGTAFRDANGNGKRDAGEEVLANAHLRFYEGTFPGSDNNTYSLYADDTITDAQGHYVLYSTVYAGENTIIGLSTTENFRPVVSPIRLVGFDVSQDLAFIPEIKNGSVTVEAYVDADNSHTRNGSETLIPFPGGDGAFSLSMNRISKVPTEIDIDGYDESFLFSALRPGTYVLHVESNANDNRLSTITADGIRVTVTAGRNETIEIGLKP